MGILKDWYSGDIHPSEDISPHNTEYIALCKIIQEEQAYLDKLLSPEDREHLNRLESASLGRSSEYAYESFAYGFKLGLLLMHEVTKGENGPEN